MADNSGEQEASTRLEDVVAGARLTGLSPSGVASVVTATWRGTSAMEVVFRTDDGQLGERLFYRDHEQSLRPEAPTHGCQTVLGATGSNRRTAPRRSGSVRNERTPGSRPERPKLTRYCLRQLGSVLPLGDLAER